MHVTHCTLQSHASCTALNLYKQPKRCQDLCFLCLPKASSDLSEAILKGYNFFQEKHHWSYENIKSLRQCCLCVVHSSTMNTVVCDPHSTDHLRIHRNWATVTARDTTVRQTQGEYARLSKNRSIIQNLKRLPPYVFTIYMDGSSMHRQKLTQKMKHKQIWAFKRSFSLISSWTDAW